MVFKFGPIEYEIEKIEEVDDITVSDSDNEEVEDSLTIV